MDLRLASLVLLALALAVSGCGGDDFDASRLDRDEDLAESLANRLLELSVAVRKGDTVRVEGFWTDNVESTPFPSGPGSLEPLHDGFLARHWPEPGDPVVLTRAEQLDHFWSFFGRLNQVEDVRFKVKQARFNADRGRAHIKFFSVGRDGDGRREWIKGTAWIDVVAGPGAEDPWRIGSFVIDTLASKVSREELFSAVSVPAGLEHHYPRIGQGANRGFISHGAAVADVDLDGLIDLAVSGVERNRLYRNLGDGTFEDVSVESLVGLAPIGSGVLFLDHDNDGDPDLFMAAVGRQILLENRWVPDGELRFLDVSDKAGIDRPAIGFSALATDVDGNGFTDVYVCSYNRYGEVMPNSWLAATNGTPNLLFLNRGDGTFEEAAGRLGVDDGRWSYAAAFADVDEDGDQDLYVANDFGENAFYRNDGEAFVDVAETLGAQDTGFGMGVSFGDYDNDGDLDLHVTNMSSTAGKRILELLYPEGGSIRETLTKQAIGNSLYENIGGSFRDASADVGGLSGGWAFGGGFIDIDNDGHEDIYTPNGFVSGDSMKDT